MKTSSLWLLPLRMEQCCCNAEMQQRRKAWKTRFVLTTTHRYYNFKKNICAINNCSLKRQIKSRSIFKTLTRKAIAVANIFCTNVFFFTFEGADRAGRTCIWFTLYSNKLFHSVVCNNPSWCSSILCRLVLVGYFQIVPNRYFPNFNI